MKKYLLLTTLFLLSGNAVPPAEARKPKSAPHSKLPADKAGKPQKPAYDKQAADSKPLPAPMDVNEPDWSQIVLDEFAKKPMGKTEWAFYAEELPTGRVLACGHCDDRRIPASTQKLLTSAAALDRLGMGYKWDTKLYADNPPVNGKIKGNLYIKGFGDPALITERLYLIAADVKNRLFQEVTGDIVVDTTYFDQEKLNPAWDGYEDSDRSYVAATSAVSVNFNSITGAAVPGEKRGDPVTVYLEPVTKFVRIENTAVTGSPTSALTLVASRTGSDSKPVMIVKGSVPSSMEIKRFYRQVPDPAIYSGNILKEFMEHEGVKFGGTVKVGTVPGDARIVQTFQSPPLSEIIRYLNKYSNNFVAEMLLKTIGAEVKGPPGTAEKGVEVVKEFANDIGIDLKQWDFYDGSGLSRKDRTTARQMGRVLDWAFHNAEIFPEYAASLPVSQTDGTIRRRLKNPAVAGRIRGKTGLLDGVTALAGYMFPLGGKPIGYVIFVNGPGGLYEIEAQEDKILMQMMEFYTRAEAP